MNKPYTLIKGALLDVGDYVHSGIQIEDIEETINSELTSGGKKCVCRMVPGFLMYDIKTTLQDDEKICEVLDTIVNKLDILLVDEKEKSYLLKN